MRPSLVMRRPREVARLCATCWEAANTATTTTHAQALRVFSTGATSRSRGQHATGSSAAPASRHLEARANALPQEAPAAGRRWLSQSTSSLRESAAQARTSQHSSSDREPNDPPSSTPQTTATALPYYALFPQTLPDGPPPAGPFAIDTRALRAEFLRLQAASHPDFHHSASSSSSTPEPPPGGSGGGHSPARRAAEAVSAQINDAYMTLSSPLLRAQYLLRERHGIDLAGDEAGALAGADPEVLGAVMETREAIEAASSEEDLAPLAAENERRIEGCEAELAEAFEREDVDKATDAAVRLRYWINIRESIREWESGKPIVLQH